MRKGVIFTIILAVVAIALGSLGGCKSYKEAMANDSQQDSIAGIIAREIVDQQTFLLKGSRLTIKNYNFPNINSSTNFIQVNGDKGAVQVSPAFSGGPNGVGGFTVDGSVSNYKVTERKNGDIVISFHLGAPVGSCEVSITMYSNSARCVANINSTFRSGRAILYGNIIPVDNSVYQGRYPF
ncbi:MAG: DUF4251 domain-containing protein [Bacteroidales bacterium]|nr:DUF4251 domain-containing protein [Bacteroidales bacterium]